MKKIIKTTILVFMIMLIFSLSSCFFSHVNDDNLSLTEKKVEFTNLANSYDVKDKETKLYYYDGKNVPYIDVVEFYKLLDGFYDMSTRNVSINKVFNRLYFASSKNNAQRVIFDWKYNTVTFKNTLDVYGQKSSSTQDFSSYYDTKLVKGITRLDIEYYLGDYGFDILYYHDMVLMPLSLVNLIDSVYYNVTYNNDKIYGYYYDDDLKEVYKTNNVGKNVPNDIIEESKNELVFLLNEKYGLKEYAKVEDYRTYLEAYLIDYSSGNPDKRDQALIKIIHNILNDPHSRIDNLGYYSNNQEYENSKTYHSADERTIKISNVFKDLRGKFKEAENYNKVIYYKGDTLFLTFDEFLVGYKNSIYVSDGVYSEDAYLTDTAALFYKAFYETKKNHPEVKNIVIDVSRNGGGYVAAMFRALTFLSTKDVHMAYEVTKDAREIYQLLGDTNMNGSYEDNDVFDYNYYILESEGTFSAANAFTCYAKYSNVAKTIGKRSGGGMCAVMPYTLADGSVFTLSDRTKMMGVTVVKEGYELHEVESGAPVDIPLEYEDFYDLDKIVELIHNDLQNES